MLGVIQPDSTEQNQELQATVADNKKPESTVETGKEQAQQPEAAPGILDKLQSIEARYGWLASVIVTSWALTDIFWTSYERVFS